MNPDLLQQLGLSPNETTIYLTLLQEGGLPASHLARIAGISRVITYQTLDTLEAQQLVSRKPAKRGGILWFYPTHPRVLLDRAQHNTMAAQALESSLTQSVGTLISQYNANHGLPNVRFYDGIMGLQHLYDDILEMGSDIMLLRSPLDNDHPEFKSMVLTQIQAQVREHIRTRAIVPRYDQPNRVSLREQDRHNLVERRDYSLSQFQLPAQIIIYGDKVGITQFTAQSATTIIESSAVAASFRILFEILWSNAGIPD